MDQSQIPPTLGGLLTWLASGVGVGAFLVWFANLDIWIVYTTDSGAVQTLKKAKFLVLTVLGIALGIIATLATQYVPAGVVASLEPYYKLILTIVMIVVSMKTGNVLMFRIVTWEARVLLGLGVDRAKIKFLAANAHG